MGLQMAGGAEVREAAEEEVPEQFGQHDECEVEIVVLAEVLDGVRGVDLLEGEQRVQQQGGVAVPDELRLHLQDVEHEAFRHEFLGYLGDLDGRLGTLREL